MAESARAAGARDQDISGLGASDIMLSSKDKLLALSALLKPNFCGIALKAPRLQDKARGSKKNRDHQL